MVKILVIEDENHIREAVTTWLTFEGYEVYEANNGRLGLETAFQIAPDLILCDIAMPEMDGHKVLLEVRSSPSLHHIPFIFLTASADRDSMRRGMELGADDYVTKPFTHAEVLNAVASRLQKYQEQQYLIDQQFNQLNDALAEERQQRLLKSRLVAMFSHDFRNPLSVIVAGATLLRDYDDQIDTEFRHKKLQRIIRSADQLLQMLDDLLLVVELESGHFEYKPELVDISNFIQAITEEFQDIHLETHAISFQSDINEPAAQDPKLLRQIVSNLVSNAIKYSPPGSAVEIILCSVDSCFELTVQDHGIGIPPASLPQLFVPFHRAANAKKVKGTGLGLTIVKEALEACGGTIVVTSVLGEGSKFTVKIPRKPT